MTAYKTTTHQNLSVWARRLGLEIADLDKAATFADKLYGQASRRGVLTALAMKYCGVRTDTQTTVPQNVACGLAMGNVLYDLTYGDQNSDNIFDRFRMELDRVVAQGTHCTQEQSESYFEAMKEIALDFVSKGTLARWNDQNPPKGPSIANAIIRKARGY